MVVLNDVARSIIESQRGLHPTHVFTYIYDTSKKIKRTPIGNIRNTAWKKARIRAAMTLVHQHPDCDHLEDKSISDKSEVTYRVVCRRNSVGRIRTTVYTLDDYNQEREANGLKALTERDSTARLWVYLNGANKFFTEQWPEYHAFSRVRVHDLKHIYGRRLTATDVPLEFRKVLLGHTNGDITSHYSAAQIDKLIEYSNRACGVESRKSPELTLVKKKMA